MYETSRYYVAVLDPQDSGLRDNLERELQQRVCELGLDPQQALSIIGADEVAARIGRNPVVGVYRGGRRSDSACIEALKLLRSAGAHLLPLVDTLDTYAQSVPAVLHPINGLVIGPSDPDLHEAVGRILEMLRLLRTKRRLFISYRRIESREAALQLYDTLQSRRFDVFLDTHGVQAGDRVQDELGQRLLDADVMVFLDTTGAIASTWIQHEIEVANSLAIGVLQVIFPRPMPSAVQLDRALFTELCDPLELFDTDFEGTAYAREGGERLKPETLERIAIEVEGLRARSMAARRNRPDLAAARRPRRPAAAAGLHGGAGPLHHRAHGQRR
ncbi:MAG: toll/interleukin-1 receptor domain-containing protein [Rhodospirillales bacterium]|nr:toll/interleukin-1 receptor domain-containing protein [Rhodospirillales bacterium]